MALRMAQSLKQTEEKIFNRVQAELVFYTATDFFEKGLDAAKEFDKVARSDMKKFDIWRLSFPICNLSFSLELILKLLVDFSEEKNHHHTHDLYKLYFAIPESFRLSIENHFETCGAHNHHFPNWIITPTHLVAEPSRTETVKIKIEDALKRCKLSYINFRYLYEKSNEIYYFDFKTLIKLLHSSLAVAKSHLEGLGIIATLH